MEPLQATPRHALLRSLQQAVQAALDARHVGVPVFVRWIAQTDGDERVEALAEAVAVVSSWLGAPARSVYVQGSEHVGQITATLRYAGGQSALVSVSAVSVEATHASPLRCLDLMLLGNTGGLYHESGSLSPALLSLLDAPAGELPSLPAALRRALEQSLSTGMPVMVTACEEA